MKNRSGFTIVELLNVIVVIAILAAITTVTYTGIQTRAHDTSVRSDLTKIARKLELWKIDNSSYPNGSTSATTRSALIAAVDVRVASGSYADQGGNMLYITDIGASQGTRYALLAVPKSGTALMVSNTQASPVPYTGTAPFPGSGYGNIATALGFDTLVSGNTVTYNAYLTGEGFRIWN